MGRRLVRHAKDVSLASRVGLGAMTSNDTERNSIAGSVFDDFSRDVYCLLGIPIDATDMASVLRQIENAANNREPFFLSTPNLNFLANSQFDLEFRESLLFSDVCVADGVSIVILAWLLGLPIRQKVAGSDIFEVLSASHNSAKPLKIFLFGGAEGVAAAAAHTLNEKRKGIYCVGSLCPGFGTIDEMSGDAIIRTINSSGADFLVVSLGAQKGQLWLQRNHHRLQVPIRAHLGAVINFQAATVRRAPRMIRSVGLEWLWRIKEEPHLWRRYWKDATLILGLLPTRIIPLAILNRWLQVRYVRQSLITNSSEDGNATTIFLAGPAVGRQVDNATAVLRRALSVGKNIVIDCSHISAVDSRFLGLLLKLRKSVRKRNARLILTGLSPRLKTIFRINGAMYLVDGA